MIKEIAVTLPTKPTSPITGVRSPQLRAQHGQQKRFEKLITIAYDTEKKMNSLSITQRRIKWHSDHVFVSGPNVS